MVSLRLEEIYRKYCRKKGKYTEEEEDLVAFLGWKVHPSCIRDAAARVAVMVGAVLVSVPILYLVYLVFSVGIPAEELLGYILGSIEVGDYTVLFVLLVPLLGGVFAYVYLLYAPYTAKERLIQETIPTLPEVVGYMVMSMKLSPNLERAIEFAGERGRGRLAEELKKLAWDLRLGMYTGVEEALDRLAYRWGVYIEEVKQALIKIRGSLVEKDPARRDIILDGVIQEIINRVKDRMIQMASAMYVPSIQLFYLGVFMPLLLFIVLPLAAAFTETPIGTLPFLVGIYLVVLPALVYTFGTSIVSKRPSVYEPPVIPKDLVDWKKIRARAIAGALLVLVLGGIGSYFLHKAFDTTLEKVEVEFCGVEGCLREMYGFETLEEALQREDLKPIFEPYDLTPYVLVLSLFFTLVLAIYVYIYLTEKPLADIQKRIVTMEQEFKDAVYILASRMAEGKPFESALDSVSDFMRRAEIVKGVFTKLGYNVRILGLSLRDAVFDKTFGALKGIPSDFLRRSMEVLVNAVELGTEVASRVLISFSDILRNQEAVNKSIREKMSEISVMMTSMATFVGPLVLGITVALQQIIVGSISGLEMEQEVPQEVYQELGFQVPEVKSVEEKMASPLEFLIVTLLYNAIVTALLTYVSVRIAEGNNPHVMKLSIARNLVISTLLFSLAVYVSMGMVGGML